MESPSRHMLLILCLLTGAMCGIVQAQWIQTDGPYGGRIHCLAVSEAGLFAGTDGSGVYRSTDNGTSWTARNSGLAEPWVHALAAVGSNLFAGTWAGIYRSTNYGERWSSANAGLTNTVVQSLASNGKYLFAGTLGGGVFVSTNNGSSWTEATAGLTSKDVYALVANGGDLFAGTFGGGVFRSTDNGTSWTAVNEGLTKANVRSLAVNGKDLIAGTWGGGAFRSTNNGTSWTPANAGVTNNYVLALAANGATVFLGTSTGAFRSTDNGGNWTAVNAGLTDLAVLTLAFDGTNIVAGTEDGGVCLSTDNGGTWTGVNSGLTNTNARALAVSGANIFAGTNGGAFISTDYGKRWTAINSGLTNKEVYALALSGSNLFAGTFGGGVFLSTNNGTHWTPVNSSLTNGYVRALAVSGTDLFAGTYGGGVFRSTNNGTGWSAAITGLTNLHVFALAVSGPHLFAGTEGGGVFHSSNGGTGWNNVSIGGTTSEVYALAVIGPALFAGTWGGGVFRSTDNGTSWTAVNMGLTNGNILSLAAIDKNLFAGTTDGVFVSASNGASWTAVNAEMTNTYVFSFALRGTHLFAGTYWHGVWRRPIYEMISPLASGFQRGLNLIDWFNEPRSGQININRYTTEDFQTLKTMGCQAVRVPIDLLHLAGPAPLYQLDSLFLAFLDLAVDRAEAAGLFIMLLNGSWDPVIGTDPAIEPALLATWTQMARHFKYRSKLVMYEVLNEPHGIADAVWNTIQAHVIQAIRAEDAFHAIVVTPANWSSCDNLTAMPVYTDTNLVYTFHFYDPHLFTHQGTTWGDPVPAALVGVPFPYNASTMPSLPASLVGTWWQGIYNTYPQQGNETWVKSRLDNAVYFKTERDVPLLCGEFGAYPPPSPSVDRATWTRIVRSYLEENGITWIYLTDWFTERGVASCYETDLDTMVTSALGLTAPAQKEPASRPEASGFTVYDDFISPGLIESGWFTSGEYDLYSSVSPHDGKSCLKITGIEQYATISFRFNPFRDLSFLVNNGSTLEFWIRCASRGTRIDVRFEDTKTSDPNDHPWRRSRTLDSSVVAWDGAWHHVSIPLKDFVESGSWDNNQWYNPQGLFNWKAADRLTISADHHSLNGISIYFDQIRITDPTTRVTVGEVSPGEFRLHQNYPNPFNGSTVISYELPVARHVELSVYNLLGQRTARLVSEVQPAGIHDIRWDARDVASGVYLYRLQAGELIQQKRLVLIR